MHSFSHDSSSSSTRIPLTMDAPLPPDTSADDHSLMEGVARRDPSALAELFDRHAPLTRGLLEKLVGRPGEAEELLQEVFLQVWSQADRYRPERGSPKTWILMMARSRAIDRLRSRKARRAREEETAREAVHQGFSVALPQALQSLEEAERRQRVHRALGGLPNEQRTAIEMAFFGGLSYRQVAEELDTPLGTIKSRILLGMRKLRAQLGSRAG